MPEHGGDARFAPGLAAVGGEEYRRALARHAAGVVVITAQNEGVPVGLTATSFTSVSLTPPLVSFFVAQSSRTWRGLRTAGHFAVNVLAENQADIAARFAVPGADRFAPPTRWTPGPAGVPLLDGVAAHLVCESHHTAEVGDHMLVVGLVTDTTIGTGGDPLLYHQGRFGGFLPY